MRGVVLLIAVLSAIFGALMLITKLGEYRPYASQPRELTVTEAIERRPERQREWVTVRDVLVPCNERSIQPRGLRQAHRIAYGSSLDERIILEGTNAAGLLTCSDQPKTVTGLLFTMPAGYLMETEFPGRPWHQWPTKWQTRLDTDASPQDSLAVVLTGFGLLFFAALMLAAVTLPHGTIAADSELYEGLQVSTPSAPGEPVIPARPLTFAAQWYGQLALELGQYLLVLYVIAVLAGFALSGLDNSAGARTLTAIWSTVALVAMVAMFLHARRVWRQRRILGSRIERLAPVLSHQLNENGFASLRVRHPSTGKPLKYRRIFNEPEFLMVGGFVLLLSADPEDRHPVLVRSGFLPLKLSSREQRESLMRLKQRIQSEMHSRERGP